MTVKHLLGETSHGFQLNSILNIHNKTIIILLIHFTISILEDYVIKIKSFIVFVSLNVKVLL